MGEPLRVLLIEDSEDDASLLLRALRRGGYSVTFERVETAAAMHAALDSNSWDIIISDYSLPQFSAIAALHLLQARAIDLPFIIVSGTIGEDTAVAAMRAGAHDYLMKGHLARLTPAVARELRDATNRQAHRQLEAQLRQAQKMEAIGQLAGGIAHDFNNLLTAMIGYVELALDQLPPDAPARNDILEVRTITGQATALTQQLLAFSRKQILQPQPLDLNSVVDKLDSLLHRLIGEHILVRTELDPALGLVVADPSQIEQVILNLAINARDAMPHGGSLTISTVNIQLDQAMLPLPPALPPGAYVSLRVRDTGIGMDATTIARIFEPFYTTKGPERGTGLGLSTVYGIVTQSGGTIQVESAPGAGTTFIILLPRSAG